MVTIVTESLGTVNTSIALGNLTIITIDTVIANGISFGNGHANDATSITGYSPITGVIIDTSNGHGVVLPNTAVVGDRVEIYTTGVNVYAPDGATINGAYIPPKAYLLQGPCGIFRLIANNDWWVLSAPFGSG